ncbi:MAG: hypothetical protein R3181_10230 [Rubricoccaceae bacterium]|nr:hypothetical protein [Rubricoccaceae bacterium]
MHRLLLLALALLVLVPPALAQAPTWTLLSDSPSAGRHEDLAFIDPETGWVVNGSGEVWRTLDGGQTWDETARLSGYLRSAGFASATKGWVGVLFSSTRLYETLDGGLTFTDISSRIQPAAPAGICGLWVVNDQVAYGVGEFGGPAFVVKTADGGQTWTSQSLSSLADTAVDVFFLDEQRGFIAAGVGGLNATSQVRVLATTDGGDTWTVRYTSARTGAWGWKLSFPTPEVGYVSAELNNFSTDGFALKTTDGGQTWEEVPIPGGGSLQGIGFATPEVGWTSGRGSSSVTTDGGETWEQISLDGSINRFRFYDGVGYAAGGRVYKVELSPVAVEPGADGATRLVQVAPNPAPGALTATYHLARTGPVHVAVLDVHGRTVAVLADGVEAAGTQVARWGAGAEGAAPGAYLLRLQTEDGVWVRTVTLLGR